MSKTWAMRDGNWVMQANGQPLMLEGFDKANQDVLHVLMHPYDADEDYGNEGYGGEIRYAEQGLASHMLHRDISSAIRRLQEKQRLIPTEYLPDDEKVIGIKRLQIRDLPNLSVAYFLVVEVVSITAGDIEKAFRISNRHRYPDVMKHQRIKST